MNQFDGTVDFYRKYRPDIPREVADVLVAALDTGHHGRLLDVGTGTGLVVEALLDDFDDIIGADTDENMLEAARAAVLPRKRPNQSIRFEKSSAEAFEPELGWHPDLVTICRAFHWLDQAAVLNSLDTYVAPNGIVAIFGDNSFWVANSDWKEAVKATIKDFLGEERRAGAGTFSHHNRSYADIMRESPFSVVTEHTVPVRRTWTTDGILGYLYSTSFASPTLFGDRLAAFDVAVRDVLLSFGRGDEFLEENEFLIRIGRRPQS